MWTHHAQVQYFPNLMISNQGCMQQGVDVCAMLCFMHKDIVSVFLEMLRLFLPFSHFMRLLAQQQAIYYLPKQNKNITLVFLQVFWTLVCKSLYFFGTPYFSLSWFWLE